MKFMFLNVYLSQFGIVYLYALFVVIFINFRLDNMSRFCRC